MARQASSSIGGIAGGIVGIVIFGALIATPFYISSLGTDRTRLSESTADAVEIVRRAVLNMDEHLLRISQLSDSMTNFGDVTDDVTIPKERIDHLQQLAQAIKRAESADTDRGTEVADVRIPAAASRARSASEISNKLKTLTAEHNKLISEAKSALQELQSATSGDLTGGNSMEGARIKAIFEYASGRVRANHAAFLAWQAEEALHDASPLVSKLNQLKHQRLSIAMLSPIEVSRSIGEKMTQVRAESAATQAKLDQIQGTVDDYKARIQSLDATSRMNRLQMAEMQTRSERIHDPSSGYASLAEGARQAEAQADALRFGTLQNATRVMASVDDLVGREYEGGSPVVGLFALEEIAANLREQVANLKKAEDTLAEQRRHFDAEDSAVQAAMDQTLADAETLNATIQEIINKSEQLAQDQNKAADEAVKHMMTAATAARTAGTAIDAWFRESEIPDPSPESAAAEFNALMKSDGHSKGSMQFLEGECAYQIASIRNDQIRLAIAVNDLSVRVADVTDNAPAALPTDSIEQWRDEALSMLAKAQTAYESAARSFPRTQATLAGRNINGKDIVWHAQAGSAAVHLLRSVLKDDAADRKAEKDAAYEILQKIADGRSQSALMTPTIDMILELQSNPS